MAILCMLCQQNPANVFGVHGEYAICALCHAGPVAAQTAQWNAVVDEEEKRQKEAWLSPRLEYCEICGKEIAPVYRCNCA